MMANMTIKAKLILMLSVAVLGLVLVGGTGYRGLQATNDSIDEIGGNRLPSVVGLYQMQLAMSEVQRSTLNVALWENDYKAQSEFANLNTRKQGNWSDYQKGFKIYEPLPQTKDEADLWKLYLRQYEEYKKDDVEVDRVIDQLACLVFDSVALLDGRLGVLFGDVFD